MSLPLTDDQVALAESAAAFAHRHAPLDKTRAEFAQLAAGGRPGFWEPLVRQGLHAVHLPEQVGGAGAGIPELAVVAEQLATTMLPGPFLPTVLTSAALACAGAAAGGDPAASESPRHPLATALLEQFAEGATGALVAGPDTLTANRDGDGWRISGCSAPALGLPGAEIVLVAARIDDAPGTDAASDASRLVWFRLDPASHDSTVRRDEGTDLTRAVGHLELVDHAVAAHDVLPGFDRDRLDATVLALLAAEASGVSAWCLKTAVKHVKVRRQFGKPVGSFQAVQHKAAMLLVLAETATAAAWDAARSVVQPPDQQRLAAAHAAVTALPAAVDAALECVTLLGGIGFTWEHDAHLYWRRAISVSSVAGAQQRWESRLGAASLEAERDFSLDVEAELPEFRASVASVLDKVLTLPDDGPIEGWTAQRGGPRRFALAEAGLVAPQLPAPYGLAAGPAEQAVIAREFARRGLAQPTTKIGEWAMPTILQHGTPEQQERFLPATLRGDILWCQLFSEPGAGSDLAALSTKAARVDGGWMVNGQKVWTSSAQHADFGMLLARTDPHAPKHQGISYFLLDLRSSGVDVRPLKQATGHSEFNEVFLDDVFIPDDCLVGKPGEGWRLAITTLANERLNMGATRLNHGSSELVRELLAKGEHAASRAETLRVLGRSTARELTLSSLNLRSVLRRMSGSEVGAEISVVKVYAALAMRWGSRELTALLGPLGALWDTSPRYVEDHLGLPAILFGGGTVEIQLNVIAQRVLGLPR